jgi:hypothetical protein
MSSASDKATGDASACASDSSTKAEPPVPTTNARLKLINTALSSNGEHILVHFVSTQDEVLTVQLEIAFAARFHQSLGNLLDQLKAMEAPRPQWH